MLDAELRSVLQRFKANDSAGNIRNSNSQDGKLLDNCRKSRTGRTGNYPINRLFFTGDPCRYALVNRRIYAFTGVTPIPTGKIATEIFLKSHCPITFVDMNNKFYQVQLPAGEYLLLIEEEGKLYPVFPIAVEPGELTEKHLSLNKAVD